jgi:hypothetical protein
MTTWVLNAVGLLAITTGALMLFLHLHRASLTKERKLMRITLGLLSAWFVIQYLGLILT